MKLPGIENLAVSDTGFLFDPATGATFTLNPTGQFVLLQLKAGKSVVDIEHGLQEAFQADEEDLKRDILEFIHLLKNYGLIQNDSG